MEVATKFLLRRKEDPGLLGRIVIGDETWVHHFDPESKTQSVEWKHPGSPRK
jgi:hypothetical protein